MDHAHHLDRDDTRHRHDEPDEDDEDHD